MKIEEAIKQKTPFKTPQQRLMVNLLFTNNWLQGEMKNFLKEFDITIQQYNILRILRGANKPISTSIIRKRMIDKMSDTTRLISRLQKKSWVTKVTCTKDKRLVDILITQAGLALLQKIDLKTSSIDNLLNQLSEKEINELNILLDKLRG